jgi:protein TonB
MADRTFRPPEEGRELRYAALLGAGFALALFVLMALAQMMGDVRKQDAQLDETVMAYEAPEIEPIEEDEPPPPPEEEPPELEEPPPQLSLDQLDIALNPGTGGSLAGDFSLPSFASLKELGTQDFLDFSQLDQTPRPKGVFGFNFPRRLRQEKASGRIVLLLKLSHTGEVLDAQIESSNLPRFNDFVLKEVKDWEFTPPTQNGKPVNAMARLPIPIRIN